MAWYICPPINISDSRGARLPRLNVLREGIADVPLFALTAIGRFELTNLMSGRVGAESVVVCDYHYWTGSTTNSRTRFDYAQTLFCFDLKGSHLPDFSLAPRVNAAERKMLNLGTQLATVPIAMFSPLIGGARAELFKKIVATAADPGVEFSEHPSFSVRISWANAWNGGESLTAQSASAGCRSSPRGASVFMDEIGQM